MDRLTLIFDFDDTLIDSGLAFEKGLKAIGLGLLSPDYLAARDETKKQLPALHVSARNRLIYFKKALQRRNQYSASNLLDWVTRYELALSEEIRRQWQVLQREVLMEALQSYRKFILTNETIRTQTCKLAAIDPKARYFENMLTSEEAGAEKPNPAIYQLLVKEAALDPRHCIFISDQWEADLSTAQSMGMTPVLTREFASGAIPPTGVTTVSKLTELPALLEQRLGAHP